MTPSGYARRVRGLLAAAGDAARAASTRRFFKEYEEISFYGISVPTVRRLEREAFRELRGEWQMAQAVAFAAAMIEARQFESKVFGLFTLYRFRKQFEPGLLRTVEGWLRSDYCDNWALVDALCPNVTTPLVATFPELTERVHRWTTSNNLWMRRASAVTFVPLARRGQFLDSAYAVAEALLSDGEDLVHKATGWLLREAGKTDAKRLESFLLSEGPRIPRTAVRYAIERFPEARRKRLLKRTAG